MDEKENLAQKHGILFYIREEMLGIILDLYQ